MSAPDGIVVPTPGNRPDAAEIPEFYLSNSEDNGTRWLYPVDPHVGGLLDCLGRRSGSRKEILDSVIKQFGFGVIQNSLLTRLREINPCFVTLYVRYMLNNGEPAERYLGFNASRTVTSKILKMVPFSLSLGGSDSVKFPLIQSLIRGIEQSRNADEILAVLADAKFPDELARTYLKKYVDQFMKDKHGRCYEELFECLLFGSDEERENGLRAAVRSLDLDSVRDGIRRQIMIRDSATMAKVALATGKTKVNVYEAMSAEERDDLSRYICEGKYTTPHGDLSYITETSREFAGDMDACLTVDNLCDLFSGDFMSRIIRSYLNAINAVSPNNSFVPKLK